MARARTRRSLSTFSDSPRILIAGLGNAPYPSTRHSIGQYIINGLASHYSIHMSSSRGGHQGSNPTGSITLFKSKQLMNVSGPSVVASMRAGQVPPSHLVLIYDSLTHAPCRLAVRFGGSAQGHNGVKSVMASLGASATSKPFWQIRVGVGRGNPAGSGVDGEVSQKRMINKSVDAAEWVLGPLSEEEKRYWGVGGKGLDAVVREIDRIMEKLGEEADG
ncbi:peptidyl-tRNA hydrolase [Ephemerocybe angulata]|uniref:peptidyl-tRNA hydrolase n=1 Tax=Ephemerocybe angulata TaxID=980116 RepID=A0A8H6IFI5_9AGAR|nr:peptidyl-tRNA hydrolase [Tulosesus angulatus]